jgi:hypothetical protein
VDVPLCIDSGAIQVLSFTVPWKQLDAESVALSAAGVSLSLSLKPFRALEISASVEQPFLILRSLVGGGMSSPEMCQSPGSPPTGDTAADMFSIAEGDDSLRALLERIFARLRVRVPPDCDFRVSTGRSF